MQITIKRIGLALPTLLLAFSTLAVVPAFAEDGGSGTSGSGDSATVSPSPTATPAGEHGGDSQTTTETEVSDSAELHTRGSEMLQELRQEHGGKQQSDSKRQNVCESHKQGLETKFSHIVTNSQRIQSKITEIRDKVVAYQQTNNLTVANFDSLVAATQSAEQTSAASITSLQAVTPSLDCNNTSVAQDVATFKAAAQQARDNLKAYRTAVKNLLVAVEQAKGTTEGGTQ